MDTSGGSVQASRRLHSSKPPAPPPPQKLKKYDPVDVEIQEDVPPTFTVSNHRGLLKPSQEQTKEPQGLAFRKLDDQTSENDQGGGSQTKSIENKVSLAHTGETLLATFYGMLYTNDSAEKEWKLEVDGFIPVCFVQVHQNANKPFRIVAVEKTKRIMEYQVTVNTTCARNSTFVKWQDGVSTFGVRFAKEDQAEQFFSTVKRMASTLVRALQLLKQPERKAVISKMTDPTSSSNIHHTKVSLMIKLPDKQTTIMSVPGLLTMSELFEMICEKEHLNTAEHQLSLPRMGGRKITFDSGTAVGSLKIREVSIIRTVLSDGMAGSVEVEDECFEDLLDIEGEENKILHIVLPSGTRKSYRVSLDMTMKQLIMRVCSREKLNSRHHSLQYIDFKHEFLDMTSAVHELGVNQIRLMDKRGRNISRSSLSDDNNNMKFRKSSEEVLESDSSPVITGAHKENNMNWQRSKSLDVLSNDNEPEVFPEQDGHVANRDLPQHSATNGSVPITVRRNSSGGITKKKPPAPPLPYVPKSSTNYSQKVSREVSNGSLKNQSFSPIKKHGIISASTPDLSMCSSNSCKSDDSSGTSSMKTSTPENKSKRRVAPPPPQRPTVPKSLFAGGKPDAPANGSGMPVKTPIPVPRANPTPAPRANDIKLKPGQKKRPAPPRPVRPPPPQPARQSSTESKDSRSSEDDPGKKQEVIPGFRQNGDITNPDRAALSLDLEPPSYDVHEEEEDGDDDLRGVPIFIPPPPPDELPPPLDECATPVGPLTDFEANILEGSARDNLPVTVNGFVGIGKYLAPSVTETIEDEQMQTEPTDIQHPILWSKQETALETVPEHASIPVVPPPPMYSETPEFSTSESLLHTEPAVKSNKKELAFNSQDLSSEASSPSLVDIPPPLLETEVTSTSHNSEEKDRDSGLDQSPVNLNISPTAGPSENVPVHSWEEPDSASSLDVISAIPPPMDFATTRPLTPPCQFANPTVVPPEGFVEEEHEQATPRKKLNVSEALFPWMNEPQAPINATIPLAVSADKKDAPGVEEVDGEQKFHTDEKMLNKEASVVVPITTISVNEDFQTQSAGKPELKTKHDVVLQEQQVKANVAVSEVPRMKLPRAVSSDEKDKSVVPQKVEIPEPNEIKMDEVVVLNIGSMETKQSGLQQFPDAVSRPVRPENEGVPQLKPSSFYPSMEVARLESQNKPEKPETQVKPVTVAKEAEVKVKAESPSSVNISRNIARPELLVKPVKLKPKVKPENQETQVEPQVVNVEAHTPSLNNISRDNVMPELEVEAVKLEPPVKPDKTETKPYPFTLVKETRVNVEAYAPSSFIPAAEQPVEPEKPETRAEPITSVKEAENEVEPKVDVSQSFNSSVDVSKVEPQFKNEKPVLQVKPEKLRSCSVEEVITPQSKSKVERSLKTLVDSSLPEVKSGINKPVQESAITIFTVGKEDVVEAPVTPERKPTPSSHDKIKDLEERLLELGKEPVPSSTYLRTSQSKVIPAASQEPKVESKEPFAEEVIVAETKRVEFSSYEQFEELLKLDNEAKPMNEVANVENKDKKGDAIVEKQHRQQENSSSPIDIDTDLHLDLSSLRQSPEPPRPPSSSPPAPSVAHWSSVLPSPRELLSDRSTESGISINEERKRPNAVDPIGDKESKPVQVHSTPAEVQRITSAVSKPHTIEKPQKLRRPLSMPAGVLRDFKSEIVQERNKSATESDSRKSSLSDSTGVSSSSLPSSPVEIDNTESVELPRPPPFTVPPLRRYSDLAADLSFISSAAKKATEKSHEDETKPSAPPKPVNLALKRSSISVVERPRSWMGPETNNNNKRSVMVPSAFKPVSFESQRKKVAKPVDFNIKSFNAPSTVPSAPSVNSASVGHGDVSSTEKVQARSSPKEVEKPAKHTPVVTIKPRENSVGTSDAPVVSPLAKEESPSIHQPVSTGTKGHPQVKKTESRETKYEIVFSNNSSGTQGASKGGSHPPSRDLSSSASLREQIMRDASGGNKVTRTRPQSAIVSGSKFQILPADDKSSSSTGANWADVKKLAALQTGAVKSGDAPWLKRQASEPSKPDLPHIATKPPHPGKAVDIKPQPVKTANNKPQPVKAADVKMQPVKTPDLTPQPVKTADIRLHPAKAADIKPQPAVNSRPLPNVVMRTKTGQQDPTKRHSMPTYIIESADRKPTPKTNSSGGQFHFNVVKDVNTDTTVVPQGVVAAMKALREKKGNSKDLKDGQVDLEHTQWV